MRPVGASLPIDEVLPDVLRQLTAGGTLLLQAPPGAGKTTRVPLALLEQFERQGTSGKILLLQPRRLAAKAAAQHLAAGLSEAAGDRVGYRVRLEHCCSAATRIEVITDGLFLRRLQGDPALAGVACVIFDEFHERRSEAELALVLLREARPLLAPELRLLLMSATLDLAPLACQLPEAELIRSRGASHPVDLLYQPPRERESLPQQLLRALERHWLDQRGIEDTVLVFLPGQREIGEALGSIRSRPWGEDLEAVPLHGSLSLAEQAAAIRPARHRSGKVVLASSIAESSLTIAGVRLVIDSGLTRRSCFNPRTGMDALVTTAASQASATQRQGRAGRLEPGRCIRLWSAAEQQRRRAFDPPGLQETDPLPVVLQLALWGAGLGEQLPWLEPPPRAALENGQALLQQLGGVERNGRISRHGKAMARLGLHPRLAHMLLQARQIGELPLACELAALLDGRDPLSLPELGCDLLLRLDWLRHKGANLQRQQRQLLRRQLEKQAREQPLPLEPQTGQSDRSPPAAERRPTAESAAQLIGWAYPDRVALARPERGGRFLMRNGCGARVHSQDPLAGAEAMAIAAVDQVGKDARILLALPLSLAALEATAATAGQQLAVVRWDRQAQRVQAVRERRLDALVLDRSPWPDPPIEQVQAALLEGLREQGLSALPWTRSSRQLQERLCLARHHLGDSWPDRSDTALLETLSDWLTEQLPAGCRSLSDLSGINLPEALWSLQTWQRRQELDRLLPSQLVVPSGRSVALAYGNGEAVLAVKLQELFGSTLTPTVLEGRLAVTLHLLSPAGRPIQITRDLAGFWQGSYRQVRADLRGRYPKHPWPEDPLHATATALSQRRLAAAEGRAKGLRHQGAEQVAPLKKQKYRA
ncbi:MAG: ATP-dependent helicase HrpB [Cyanobacteria bacterium]|nr:ATP-dependent helicase HrpB [Cyanobacteria bacterium bin.51]